MRKGLLAGLSGLICVAVISCGQEEENPVLQLPQSVFSAGTAMAMRITGPYGPNDDAVVTTLGQMLTRELSLADVMMRGGMPDGTLEANPAGSAPEQIKAFIDNQGFLAPEDAVDLCGNPMITGFVTPDLLQDILTGSTEAEIMGLSAWPGVCAGDINCNTTKQGAFEVGFSKDHGDGSRDLVIVVAPQAGPTTVPAFQGHLISYMLTANNTGNHLLTAALYGNARSITVSAFGLVKFAKAGIATRPSLPLPGLPTKVWAFPAETRELAGADLIVGVQPWEFCEKSWAINFAGAETPVGCDKQKSLVLDITSSGGRTLWENTKEGDDITKLQALEGDLDDLVKAWEYQLKTMIACPDVSDPNWIREDIPLGSVEIFQCPDGDIDRCIAFHDMEDFFCEGGLDVEEVTELVAVLPQIIGTAGPDSGKFTGNFLDPDEDDDDDPVFQYSLNGTTYDCPWTILGDTTLEPEDPTYATDYMEPLTVDEVIAELEAGCGTDKVVFSEDEDGGGIIVEPAYDLGPNGTLAMVTTAPLNVNAKIGLGSGTSSYVNPAIPAVAMKPYVITAENADLGVAYVKLNGNASEASMIYTDEPGRILGLYNSSGSTVTLPAPIKDSHCQGDGNVVYKLELGAGAYYLKLDLDSGGTDSMTLLSTNIPSYVN